MRKTLSKFDLFPVLPTFRAEGKEFVSNLCYGIFSFIIFLIFATVFWNKIYNVLNFQAIQYKETQAIRPQSQSISNITVAVGLSNNNLVDMQNIFQLTANYIVSANQVRPISVIPCQKQMWKDIGQERFKNLNIGSFLCINTSGIEINGKIEQLNASFIAFNLSKCKNATSPVICAPSVTIDSLISGIMVSSRFIQASMIIKDTTISPASLDAFTYSPYQKTKLMLFNFQQSTFLQIFLGSYQLVTDMSFWPFFSDLKQQLGHFVTECAITSTFNEEQVPLFIQFYIYASPVHKFIDRNLGKFDSVFSFVGGLFGITVSILSFFLKSFNEYRYELRLSEGAFSFENSHLVQQNQFNFLKYLKLLLYNWINYLFCCKPNWKDIQTIKIATDEATQQIDIKHVVKRILHLQKLSTSTISHKLDTTLYMTQLKNLQIYRKRRFMMDYCSIFMIDVNYITIPKLKELEQNEITIPQVENSGSSLVKQNLQIIKSIFVCDQLQIQRQSCQQSIKLCQQYVAKYIKRYKISPDSLILTHQQLLVEQELAEALNNLQEKLRMQIIIQIPLSIICRIIKYMSQNKQRIEVYEFSHSMLSASVKSIRNATKIRKMKPIQLQVLFSPKSPNENKSQQ